jgi:hypothetical protein
MGEGGGQSKPASSTDAEKLGVATSSEAAPQLHQRIVCMAEFSHRTVALFCISRDSSLIY